MEAKEKAKEKAKELAMTLDKYCETDNAKMCALIAIDWALNTVTIADKNFKYYLEVRNEILKL